MWAVLARKWLPRRHWLWWGDYSFKEALSPSLPPTPLFFQAEEQVSENREGGGQSWPLYHFPLLLKEIAQSDREKKKKTLTIEFATKSCAFTGMSFETGSSCYCHCLWSCWCLTSYVNFTSSFLREAGVGVPGKSNYALYSRILLSSQEKACISISFCVSAASSALETYYPPAQQDPCCFCEVEGPPALGARRISREQRSVSILSVCYFCLGEGKE